MKSRQEIETMLTSLATSLAEALGTDAVDGSEVARRAHARDRWPPAAKWSGNQEAAHLPACIVRPTDESAVAAAVRAARSAGKAVIPYGAGSGVCGAVISRTQPVVIDLRAMDRIVRFDPDAALLEVEAGAIAMTVEKWLNERGFTLGHYPQSMPLATMGGLVSTRSSGTFSGRYGNIEELVAGLDVVLADSQIVRTPRTVRSATGPDLKQLFIGAEGTLGIVTKVAMRVFRMSELRWFGGYAFPTLDAGVEMVRQAYACHIRPAVLRLYDATEAASLYSRVGAQEDSPLLIVGHEGVPRMVDAERDCLAELAVRHGARAIGSEIGDAWERHRFDASWLDIGNAGATRLADAIEVSAFWPALVPLYRESMRRIVPLCSRAMGHYSHFYGTGAALYIIFFVEGQDPDDAIRRYEAVWHEVMSATASLGGSISHHHGVGRARAGALASELGSAHVVLKALKRALDPSSLFNPGHLGSEADA
ncbi:MAG TPA: FAD-binding oxidoreductase [Usitatibacter sp.]|nr:FAD-binding oxidoreductase [Usitatibacter sp.]